MILDAPRTRAQDLWTRARRTASVTPQRPSRASRIAPPAIAGACGLALGVLVGFFLDPNAGRRRRHTTRDRALSRARRGERAAAVRVRRAEWRAVGVVRRTVHARRNAKEPLDDATIKDKVESELFRRAEVPKEHVSVNVEDGVVFLRGVMDRPDQIDRMESVTRRMRGVRGVENLVHTPGTPAPASRPKTERTQ
jgi:BON domain